MIAILFGAWLFCLVSFSAVGVACRIACHHRRVGGRTCICGRHEAAGSVLGGGPARSAVPAIGTPPSRLRAAETRVRALQQRFVDGRLSMEQYETELDRVVGLA
jgi:hypothetical protein